MKKGKIVLATAAFVALIGSLAFATNPKSRFGGGTLFTKTAGGTCSTVDCKRQPSGFFCPDITYYTASDCAHKITTRPRVNI